MSEQEAGPRRILRLVVRYTIMAAVAVAVIATLWTLDPDAVALLFSARSAPYLVLATAATVVATGLGMVAWRFLLTDLPLRAAGRIFAASLLTKYLPGRLWALMTHIQMGRAAGINAGRMTSAFLLSFSVMMLAGATVSAMAAPAHLGENTWWLAIPVGVLAVFFARPRLIGQVYALAARLLRRPRPGSDAPTAGLRWSIVVSIGFWVCSGVQLWAITLLLGAEPWPALPVSVGSFAFASMIGMLVFFLPDGWGARELTMTAALSTILPVPAAATAAVASRVVCVLSEVAISGAILLATSLDRRPRPVAYVGSGTAEPSP